MRKYKHLLFLCIALSITQCLSAQASLKVLFETTWSGASKTKTSLISSGNIICKEKLYSISFNESDNTFTGISLTVLNLENREYKCKLNIRGTYYPSDKTVVIKTVNTIDFDFLPNGLRWTEPRFDLQIYLDGDHAGYYLLSGKTSEQGSSSDSYAVSTYPY